MRYTEVERRLRSLEAVVGDEAEPLSPDELCAAVLAEYSDLTPAEVCALDPPAF